MTRLDEKFAKTDNNSYEQLIVIMQQSCDFLLDFINDRLLNLYVTMLSLSKMAMRYDSNVSSNRMDEVVIDILMLFVQHIGLQVLTKDVTKSKTVMVDAAVFQKFPCGESGRKMNST